MLRSIHGLRVLALVGLCACSGPTGPSNPIDNDVAVDDTASGDSASDTVVPLDGAADGAPDESAADAPDATDTQPVDVAIDVSPVDVAMDVAVVDVRVDAAPVDTPVVDALVCTLPATNCSGVCVNVQTDAHNCGSCRNACPTGQMCATGLCVTECPAGRTVCGATMGRPGTCADLATDSANCGACGHACPTGNVCSMGACACPTGQVTCGASCVDTLRDNANCGACGHACASSQTCVMGACSCATGETFCGPMCINLMTDNANCGRCGNVCPSGSSCMGAECRLPPPANDDCARPTVVDLSSRVTATVTGTTGGATDSTNTCGAGSDVFYRFTLTQREVVYVDSFGTSWNTVLSIQRPGCAVPAVGCSDDSCGELQSQLARVLDAGSYLIVVDQAGATGGDFTLHVQHFPAGSGTTEALDLTEGMRRYSGALSGVGAATSTCCSTGPENVYYGTTCPTFRDTAFRASTCTLATFDTSVDMRSGNRSAAGGSICSDDACGTQSTATGRIPAGAGLHVLYVDSCGTPPAGSRYSIDFMVGDCPAGQTLCGSACVDLTSSVSNCGACGVACAAGRACVAGVCAVAGYAQSFPTGSVLAGSTQCTSWNAWRTSLSASFAYSRITISGSNNPTGVTCMGAIANTLCQALRTGGSVSSVSCGGRNWTVGLCGSGVELTANGAVCSCTAGYVVRPCINNGNWGGINGLVCNASGQTISVSCS